jgi:hypothetical protein
VDFEVPFSRNPVYQFDGVMMMGDSPYTVEAVAPTRRTKMTDRTILFMDLPSVEKSDLSIGSEIKEVGICNKDQ